MKPEHITALMAATLFAIGAVFVIIMQHNSATARILSSLGGNVSGSGASAGFQLGGAASLAGTPTPGQTGSSISPAVVPLNIDPGYLLN